MNDRRFHFSFALLAIALGASACGSCAGDDKPPPSASPAPTTLSITPEQARRVLRMAPLPSSSAPAPSASGAPRVE